MPWPQIVFGWPTILLALGMYGLAFLKERSSLGFVGLLLALPFLWYASHAPRGLWYSTALVVTLAGAAECLRRGRKWWAVAFVSPFAIVTAILAVAVLTQ